MVEGRCGRHWHQRPGAALRHIPGYRTVRFRGQGADRQRGAHCAENAVPRTDFIGQIGAAAASIATRRLPAVLAAYNAVSARLRSTEASLPDCG